jgi:hypothetical protein
MRWHEDFRQDNRLGRSVMRQWRQMRPAARQLLLYHEIVMPAASARLSSLPPRPFGPARRAFLPVGEHKAGILRGTQRASRDLKR